MKHLLDKYRNGNMTGEEFGRLSSIVSEMSDSEISKLMYEDWNSSNAGELDIRKKIRRPLKWTSFSITTAIAAGFLLLVTVGLGIKLADSEKNESYLAARELTVCAGDIGHSSLVLPDGTKVILNAKSTITYPSDFGLDSRKVSITGQGFFDVTKDPDKEFVVNAPGMEITVHGTKFNVYAYEDNDISEMSLLEGSVSIKSGETKLDVSPNEKVCVTRHTGRVNLVRTDNELETLWLEDGIVFINDPLFRVFDVLQRRFGIVIECLDGINLSDRYTGTFRNGKLDDVLEVLKIHYGFIYEFEGDCVRVKR